MRFVCTSELYVTVNNIKVLNVTKQCFFGEFMSPSTIKLLTPSRLVSEIFVPFQPDMDFLDIFVCKSPVSNFTEVCPLEAPQMYSDREADKCTLLN